MKWRVGEVTVTKIVELEVTGGSRFILPEATYEAVLPIGWLQPDFADERGRLKRPAQDEHPRAGGRDPKWQDGEPPHHCRYLSRQRQGEPADPGLERAADGLSRR